MFRRIFAGDTHSPREDAQIAVRLGPARRASFRWQQPLPVGAAFMLPASLSLATGQLAECLAAPRPGRCAMSTLPPGLALHHDLTGTGEPALLLHGLGSRGRDWRAQVEALATRYRVVTVDLRGHGGSPAPPGPWTMADIAHDVAAVLAALGTGPVHVGGLSLGGMVAFQLAVDHPALVRSLAIINSGPAFPGRTWRGRFLLWYRQSVIRRKGLPALGPGIARGLFPRPGQEPLRRQFVEQFATNQAAGYVATLRAIGGYDLLHRLAEVRCPVLAVSGDRDYTPVAAKEAWVRLIPGARLEVIRDSGHATTVDQPEALNRVLLAFWSALD